MVVYLDETCSNDGKNKIWGEKNHSTTGEQLYYDEVYIIKVINSHKG